MASALQIVRERIASGNFKLTDFVIAVSLVAIIALMIIPLPSLILDILITINISFSLTVILVTMFLNKPLEFAAFPSLLLVVTLFRIAINIAASRLILLNSFAGQVIDRFGSFVVGNNYIVGIIVFAIIVLAQFIVITRGSERVAEVAARFTLDAMPGKQMSIDADLNAGLIDAEGARQRRKDIEREANFFGSMDGANKFVRGDAIAGILVVLINIIGGILVGTLMLGIPPMEALQRYTLMTVGAGLAVQIPALLVSVATGLVITKAASEMSLGSDISTQLFAQPRAFTYGAIILLLLGLFTPLPKIPFFLIAASSAVIAFALHQVKKKAQVMAAATQQEVSRADLRRPESLLNTLALDPITLKTGRNLIPLIDPAQKGPLLEKITLIRYQIGQELGFVIPGVRVMDDLTLGPNQYQVDLKGTKIALGEVLLGHHFVLRSVQLLERDGLPAVEATDPVTGDASAWVSDEHSAVLQEKGIPGLSPDEMVARHFTEVVKRHADEIMTRQHVQSLLELVKNVNAAIVRELVPDMLSLGQVHKVLQLLVKERVSIRDLSTILERLADYAHISRDTNLLAEYVRQSLARQICESYADKNDTITVLTIDPRLEEMMISAVHQSEYGSFLALDPNVGEKVLIQIAQLLRNFRRINRPAIILCSPRLRPHFKRFTERSFPQLAVLSYNEIVPEVKVQSVGIVSVE
jgi:flagellar biosynthesis protein FlhA